MCDGDSGGMLEDYMDGYIGTLIVVGYRVDKDTVRYVKGKLVGLVDEFVTIQTMSSVRMISRDSIVELKLSGSSDGGDENEW